VNVFTPGYNLVASTPPLAGTINTNLNYSPSVGDNVYVYSSASQGYTSTYNYISSKGVPKWSPSVPSLGVGQAVFIQSSVTPGWTNILNVP